MKKNIFAVMVAMMILCLSTSVVMAADYTFKEVGGDGKFTLEIPSGIDDYTHAVIYHDNSTELILQFSNSPVYRVSDGSFKFVNSTKYSNYQYVYKADTGWSAPNHLYTSSSPVAADSISSNVFKLVKWASYDIKDSNGVLFAEGDSNFYLTPTLEEVVVEELTMKAVPKIMTAFSTLVACGIGFLALLISLPILRKVLGRFLPS